MRWAARMSKRSEDAELLPAAHQHPPGGDGGNAEVVIAGEAVAGGPAPAAVELVGEVGRVVGAQGRAAGLVQDPDHSRPSLQPVAGDDGNPTRIRELLGSLG